MGTSNCSAVFEGVIWSIFYRSEKVPEFKKLQKLLDSYDDFELNGWTFKLECSFSDVVEDELCGSMFCAVKEDFGVDFVNTHPMEAARGDVDITAVGSVESLKEFLKDFSNLNLSQQINKDQIITKTL